jgi:DNA anti-recombination protein RmuC
VALDSKLTQNINLRANGDQLLRPLQAFGKEIDKVIKSLGKMADGMTAGNHKSEDSLRKQVQLLQRLVGEASTLQNILNSSNNRKTLGGLDEQSMGAPRRVGREAGP